MTNNLKNDKTISVCISKLHYDTFKRFQAQQILKGLKPPTLSSVLREGICSWIDKNTVPIQGDKK